MELDEIRDLENTAKIKIGYFVSVGYLRKEKATEEDELPTIDVLTTIEGTYLGIKNCGPSDYFKVQTRPPDPRAILPTIRTQGITRKLHPDSIYSINDYVAEKFANMPTPRQAGADPEKITSQTELAYK